MNDLSEIAEVGKVRRNEKGQLLPGSVINPFGRTPGAVSLAESYRKFLTTKPRELKGKSREQLKREILFEIASDKTHKQCIEAIKYIDARAYGDIPKEVGQSVLAASLLQALPEEHKAFIAQLAFGDNNMLLADGVIEESEDTEQEVSEE